MRITAIAPGAIADNHCLGCSKRCGILPADDVVDLHERFDLSEATPGRRSAPGGGVQVSDLKARAG